MRTQFTTSEEYFNSLLKLEDPMLTASRAAAQSLNLAQISLGDFELQILKTFLFQRPLIRFVEIGTLTGTSGIALLQAMPKGAHFWTFEKIPEHAKLAEPFLTATAHGRNQTVEIVVGDAREKLKTIEDKGPFDGIFIDGNKAAYLDYLMWAEINLQKGAVIIADNIYLGGAVMGKENDRFSKSQIEVMQKFNQRLADPSRFLTCQVPTSEGLSFSVKLF